MGTEFTVEDRYELVQLIGSGAYGVVVAALDKEGDHQEDADNLVAIKKVERAFEHTIFA